MCCTQSDGTRRDPLCTVVVKPDYYWIEYGFWLFIFSVWCSTAYKPIEIKNPILLAWLVNWIKKYVQCLISYGTTNVVPTTCHILHTVEDMHREPFKLGRSIFSVFRICISLRSHIINFVLLWAILCTFIIVKITGLTLSKDEATTTTIGAPKKTTTQQDEIKAFYQLILNYYYYYIVEHMLITFAPLTCTQPEWVNYEFMPNEESHLHFLIYGCGVCLGPRRWLSKLTYHWNSEK